MKFMSLVKANADYEAGNPPSPKLIEAIGKLSMEGIQEGWLVQSGGLLPSKAGAKVRATSGKLTVTDGPFSEAKELVGGFAILKARSRDEAITLGRRFLQAHIDAIGPSFVGELEIRQMFEGPDCQ